MTDLSRAVALAIEPEPPRPGKLEQLSGKQAWESPYLTYAWYPRPFASDRNLLPLILAEVERRNLRTQFMDNLLDELNIESVPHTLYQLSFVLEATPEQICRSFLTAVGAK